MKRLMAALAAMLMALPAGAARRGLAVDETPDGLLVSARIDRRDLPLFLIQGQLRKIPGSESRARIDYRMPHGKKSECRNTCTGLKYLTEGGDTLSLRIYRDGVAWRTKGVSRVVPIMPKHHWAMEWNEAYEGFFPADEPLQEGKRYAYPLLMEHNAGTFVLLSESGIDRDNAATSVWPEGEALVLRPDGPEQGGWQTAVIGDLATVTESTLVNDNSIPSRLADTSWIHPGTAAWVYWAYNHGSNDCGIIARYTDLAADLGLPYVLIDAEWDEMKEGKTVEDAVAYAVGKGVKPMIWYNSSIGWVDGAPGPKYRLNTPEDREREFAWCEKIGVKGVKIDFFAGDTNRNFRLMADLLEDAARHGLLVNFHGATVPRGWQRTYPNLITNEGVYGAEWYNNLPVLTDRAAAHNATLPFTRNVVASMDYTPCAFTDSQHPHITTHAHELALTALFESGIQHLADRPESFMAQPDEVKRYLGELPTAWDETKLISGYPGDHAVMARRKGDRWYIAAINGTDTVKTLTPDWSRLPEGLTGLMFEDSGDAANPWKITQDAPLPASIELQPCGGLVWTGQQ